MFLRTAFAFLAVAAICTIPGAGTAAAATFTLDTSNGYSAGPETGTISRTGGTSAGLGFFVLSGLTLDYADTPEEENLTQFGGAGFTACIGCTRRSKDLLIDQTGLIFTVLDSNNIYTGLLTFFMFRDLTDASKIVPGSVEGVFGSGFLPSASFDLSLQTGGVPLPGALPLYGTGLAVMGFLVWRRKRKALRD